MEQSTDSLEILEQLMCPAFFVKDGIIVQANQAALQRQIPLNTPVTDLILIGKDEYDLLSDGRLCLTLCINDITYSACVTAADGYHIFHLESDYEEPELRAFALAAQQLREPLANAMASTDLLLPNAAVQENPETRQQAAQINQSLHQLLRVVCNMSDAAHYRDQRISQMQTRDAAAIFEEILEKAAHLTSQAGYTLHYKGLQQTVYCLVDAEKLERAVLNLISNAIKYAPKGSTLNVSLHRSGNHLYFTVRDNGAGVGPQVRGSMFSRFLREPGIEDGRSGIGLGMHIVRSAAAAHGGTVLFEQPEGAGTKVTMSIMIRQSKDSVVRSPVMLPVDYAGGWDRCLIELSDVLPDTLDEQKN